MTKDPFIYMKVGSHAGESFEQIIARKNQEVKDAGRMFWGYGGNTCHPTKHVQPFIRREQANGHRQMQLFMQLIRSKDNQTPPPSRQFSVNGEDWLSIPNGIRVTGSSYALVLGEILPGELIIDPNALQVGIGPSAGKQADKYIQGRVDKACLIYTDNPVNSPLKGKGYQIGFKATLLEPYAVFVR